MCTRVHGNDRRKGPIATSLVGTGTSGGPAALLVNMLLLCGLPLTHTRYHMRMFARRHADTQMHLGPKPTHVLYRAALPEASAFAISRHLHFPQVTALPVNVM